MVAGQASSMFARSCKRGISDKKLGTIILAGLMEVTYVQAKETFILAIIE